MSLGFYYQENFSTATRLDPVDVFVGTGSQTTFTLTNKTGASLASTITAANVQYYQFTGGMIKSGNNFTLSSAPALNAQIVAPGIIALVFDGYDQEVVAGVTNPRIVEKPVYLGDPDQPHLFNYTNLPQYAGIRVSISDLISGAGASTAWVQLACADPVTGLAMTYGATGDALLTAAIYAYGTLSASSAVGASSVTTVATPLNCTLGDYLIINPGDITEERRKIKEITSNKIGFFTNLEYAHSSGEDYYDFGRKIWVKVTIPVNAANNQAFNFWDNGLRVQSRNNSKV